MSVAVGQLNDDLTAETDDLGAHSHPTCGSHGSART